MNPLEQNYFQLFGLPARFAVEAQTLEARYRELQREVHPDRFASASAAEQRLSLQLAARVNEAYRTLKSPLARARYLLELRGVDPQLETSTAMPLEFLAEQLELREALEEASHTGDRNRAAALARRLRAEREALFARLAEELESDPRRAAATLRQLMFFEKLGEELGAVEERREG